MRSKSEKPSKLVYLRVSVLSWPTHAGAAFVERTPTKRKNGKPSTTLLSRGS